MTEDQNNITPTEEVKEKVIGEFTPKRKFLNFVSAVNGLRIRFISDIAFIKGEKLTGLGLDNVIFKVTICDEGTIKFEEVDTNVTDTAYRKRLIEDICDRDVTGYAKKYVVGGLEFADKDGKNCYLEVEEAKPIDKLKSLFDDMDNKTEISDKGRSFLDELLGESSETEVETTEEVTETKVEEEVKEEKQESMMEAAFRKMNEDKINELKDRVEAKEKEIRKSNAEISQAEKKIKTDTDQLRVLNTRLETLSPGDEPNGYVFLVSDEQKNETGLDETTRAIADKIADLMNLKKEVLFNYLTGGFYKIKIGKKGENDKKLESIDREILEKVLSIDPLAKMSMSDTNEIEYRGDLNWHQLTSKMIRKGFEQDPEFDKISGSNSYEAKTEDDGKNWTGTKDEKKECSHDNCGCGDKEETKEADDHMSGYKSEIERMAKGLGMKGVNFGENGIELIPEDKKEDKTKLLKNIDTPQDIVIVGMTVGNNEVFSITDDFSRFSVKSDNKKFRVESDGFVSIVSVKEFLDFKDKDEDSFEMITDGAAGAVLLQNFSGEIRIGVSDNKGNSDYDFDLNDYILHQHNDISDVIVELPTGTNAVEINDQNIISLLRDGKISTILNEKI